MCRPSGAWNFLKLTQGFRPGANFFSPLRDSCIVDLWSFSTLFSSAVLSGYTNRRDAMSQIALDFATALLGEFEPEFVQFVQDDSIDE